MYWEEKDEELIVHEVLHEYNLRQLKKIKKSETGYKIMTEKGPKHLKKYSGELAGIKFVRRATEHLAKQGFRRINRFILTKYGEPYVQWGKDYWYLTDWRDGRECDFDKLPQLDLAVKTLAQFHQAARGLTCTEDEGIFWGEFKDQLVQRGKRLQDWGAVRNSGEFLGDLQVCSQLWEQINLESLRDNAQKEGVFAHGAYGESALLRVKETGMFIVKEEPIKRELQVFDLARLLSRYLPKYKWDLYVGKLLLDIYDAYRPLQGEEWKVLVSYLAFPMRKYRLFRKYQTEVVLDESNFMLKLQEEAELDRLKREFLQQIIREREIGLVLS
ncbi:MULTISPECIES: hypothetical protein [unclassified Carboxydocella]|uniref:hypothetical protein n=1 Tax=unclassified Carboxydocella TaxID=2685367 RepID=UPI0009AE5C6F|nr:MULTISPECIES: hypothetical protein [unclassified Carboxydocella]GAW29750.1 hypothetical protein ULO1_23200 [Carboxydocella sp. ULO1]GAW32435.1 hypothetical protein JDF658_22000 [Carboxydocella sp. JDF658]